MSSTELPQIPVIIIGGGFSGLAMGAQLKRKLNFTDYIIYERSPDFGGTWFANTYPGCGVDVPTFLYSLSFAPNPDAPAVFPKQPDILEYIHRVAKDFEVDKHIQLNTSWDGAVWQESTKTWLVRLSNVSTGEKFTQECNVLISGAGLLVDPNSYDISGAENFQGTIMHTARWKQGTVLADKNVIVVGNGCSAAQVVPAIAPECRNVYQFMRTPQFFVPQPNLHISPLARWAFRCIPFLLTFLRYLLFNFLEYNIFLFYKDARGYRHRIRAKRRSDKHVETNAPKEYWELLKPKYDIGCKRRIIDHGYLKSLRRDNVHLTDDPIVEIIDTAVITKSGKHYPADVIVLANGFKLSEWKLDLVGRNAMTLEKHWAQFGGAEAYQTTACSSFPNFFFLFGPNSATGHTSYLFALECVVELIIKVAGPVITQQAATVEVKYEHEKRYSDKQQTALSQRVWIDCRSWYKSQGGWNFSLYPFSSYTLWMHTRFSSIDAWSYGKVKEN